MSFEFRPKLLKCSSISFMKLLFFALMVMLSGTESAEPDCAKPSAISDGSFTPDLVSYPYGDSITYSCATGFSIASGDVTRSCDVNATWSGTEPTCSAIQCTKPPAITNGSFVPDLVTYAYNAKITHSCDTGYSIASGDITRSCGVGAAWSGNAPTCSEIDCAKPPVVTNGNFVPILVTYPYSTSITYSCDTGYSIASGDVTRSCGFNAVWSGNAATCAEIDCGRPPSISNGSFTPDLTTYPFSTSITYSCETGYSITSGDVTRSCGFNAVWSGTEATCTEIDCGRPPAISNGTFTPDLTTYPYNTNITYSCETGYSITSGDVTRSCGFNAVWSGMEATCTEIDCGRPPAISNGSFTPDLTTYPYSTSIMYSCETGYSTTSGDVTRSCGFNAVWSGTEVTCTEIDCGRPPAINNGSFTPDLTTYPYNTSIMYSCETGYSITSGDVTRSCGFNAVWSGTEVTCTEKDCGRPQAISNGSFTPDLTTYPYSTSLTYSCETGYSITSGDVTRSCGFNAVWSGTEVTCTEIDCGRPPAISNGTFTPDFTTYPYNTNITYSCETGYSITSGDVTRSCGFNAVWSGTEVTCTELDCAKPPGIGDGSFTPDLLTYAYNTDITYSCNTGFSIASGDVTRSCGFNASWSGTEPTCSELDCAKPQAISGGSFVPDSVTYAYNTDITYSCDTGYGITSGDVTRTCGFNSTWSGSELTCTELDCPKPPVISNGSFTPELVTYNYSSSITYSCDTGYSIASGDVTRSCGFNTIWTGTEPTCSELDCAKPPAISDGSFTPNSPTYAYSTSITYSCNTGFSIASGDVTRSCGFNAAWSGTELACAVSACLKPSAVAHATFSPDSVTYAFFSTLTYTCTTGYYHTAGDLTWTCQNTGAWLGATPTCSLVTCTAPTAVDHSDPTPTQAIYNYNTAITYTCHLAYNHTLGDLVRTCDANHAWTGSAPVCTISACIKPADVTFSTMSLDKTLYDFGEIITYTCNLAYNLTSGDLVRTCENTGNWSGAAPVCTVSYCTQPAGSLKSTFDPVLTLYEFNSILTYTCDKGYYHTAGDLTWTCLNTGLWQGTAPTCPLVTCAAPPTVANSGHTPAKSVYDYQENITYTCDLSFNRTDGDPIRMCDHEHNWTGMAPVCTVAWCIQPSAVVRSTVDPDIQLYEFGETATYTCEVGYNHTTGDLVRTCLNTGAWTGDPPLCPIVTCPAPATEPHSSYIPFGGTHNYDTSITYTCDLGYELTGGSSSRKCNYTATWTNEAPVCTIKHCPPPALNANMTYVQVLPEHDWNTNVTYSCDIGYMYLSGDMVRVCQDSKTWDGTTPACEVVTCPTTAVDHMSCLPNLARLDYLALVTYSCDIGYNHTTGDLVRQCSFNGSFDGDLPNCTIVTCDPPSLVAHASTYTPVLVEHNYNTDVTYSCDADYHYVSGTDTMTCDHEGNWPGVDYDCSVQHSLALAGGQTNITIMAIADTSAAINFDFDGMCSVAVAVTPTGLSGSAVPTGTSIVTTITKNAGVVPDIYTVTLSPSRLGRTWDSVYTTVFYGESVAGITARLVKDVNFLLVGELAQFETNLTAGTNVTIEWQFDVNTTATDVYGGHFTTATQTHTFLSAAAYTVTIVASNLISQVSTTVDVVVIYGINEASFVVDSMIASTTVAAVFSLSISPSVQLSMGTLDIAVNFSHGTEESQTQTPSVVDSYPLNYNFVHLFGTQGIYNVTAVVTSPLDTKYFEILLNVWDSLDSLTLIVLNDADGCYVTNTTTVVGFDNVPNAGFEFTLFFGDGSNFSSNGTEILYRLYDLGNFSNVYTSPLVYPVTWTAQNGWYSNSGLLPITVQNVLTTDPALYTMEPILLKYPWSALQYLDLEMNFTLNATADMPTNATCIFDAADGTPTVPGVDFDDFFEVPHRFLLEGVFNSSYSCANKVSAETYYYSNTVVRFQASDIFVEFATPVPMNISDPVTVYFHVRNTDFALLPLNVSILFNWDDGTPSLPDAYYLTTYTHVYQLRGNYSVTLDIDVPESSTTASFAIDLRVGIMYTHVNILIGFINTTRIVYTMWGDLGNDTTYTVSFDDGTPDGDCNAVDYSGCFVDHYFPHHGYMNVTMTARNDTFTEVDGVMMTIDNPIVDLFVDLPDEISIPDGYAYVKLNITEFALYLPDLNCQFDFADAIDRERRYKQQTVRYGEPFTLDFQYISLGRRTINIYCWNLINETTLTHLITVTNENFDYKGTFDRQYSQEETPMFVSSMLDNLLLSRIGIEADFDLKTPFYAWTMDPTTGANFEDGAGALFPRGTIAEGTYRIILSVSFVEEPQNAVFEPTYLMFIDPPPHAYITGGSRRYASPGTVLFDAIGPSFDPVFPDSTTALSFTWDCLSYSASSFGDLESRHQSGGASVSCSLDPVTTGQVQLTTAGQWYAVTVTATDVRGNSSQFTQYLSVIADNGFSIKCHVNCLSKVALSSKIVLMADMPNNCPATFTWTLQTTSGTNVPLDSSISDTGANARTLSIKPHQLDPGQSYRVALAIIFNGVGQNTQYYEFITNRKPAGGTCSVFPYEDDTAVLQTTGAAPVVKAVETEFNLTCTGWQDDGFGTTMTSDQPLNYFFFLQYGDRGDIQKQILYYDAGSTAPLVTFRVGDPLNDYRATVKVRIADIFGDYEEFAYDIKAEPQLTTPSIASLLGSNLLAAVSGYIEPFIEDIKTANRSRNVRTLATQVEALASVYTDLAVETDSGALTLTPDDLIALGYKRTDDGRQVSWTDYWNLIINTVDTSTQDYLIERSGNFTGMLLYQLQTWPSRERVPVKVIEHVIRALNTTISNVDYMDVDTAKSAADIVSILSTKLRENAEQRVLPSTESLESAATGILDAIRNILEFLQTVLTPNLPYDPTVDEMRNYLEYISVFKTADELLTDPLSLQEQTFVAQKQLQKYAVDKEIKAEASKIVLPKVEAAVFDIGKILERMMDIGHPYLSLDNDFLHISTEVNAAYQYVGKTLWRPRVVIDLENLTPNTVEECGGTRVAIQTLVYRENPYFFGEFGDRITSFVPSVRVEGAQFGSNVRFYLENKVVPECVDETPTYDEDDPDKLIYLLFDRQHIEDNILLFIRPNDTRLKYELFFRQNEKPTIDADDENFFYRTNIDHTHWTLTDGYKLLISAEDVPHHGKIWIGFKPILDDIADEAKRLELLNAHFCANITAVNCLAWNNENYAWDKSKCTVSQESTRQQTICDCENQNNAHVHTIGTTFYVPHNVFDYKRIDFDTTVFGNEAVLGTIIAVMLLYVLLLGWTWREDIKDQYKWDLALLVDNDIADDFFYIIKVYTGMRTGAGTRSKIGFVLVGEHQDTGIRILDDDSGVGFESGSIRSFVMGTRVDLGEMVCMRIWHDDSGGSQSAWFLNKVIVRDLQTDRKYYFNCDNWLSNEKGDRRCDKVLRVSTEAECRSLKESASYMAAENHLLISVFVRPFRTNFSRIQRLSCVLSVIFISMFFCTTVMSADGSTSSETIKIGPFYFSVEIFLYGLLTAVVASIPIFIVCFFFKHAKSPRPKQEGCLRRWYRKGNNKTKLDESVVTSTYMPPGNQAVGSNFYILPHFCAIISWVVVGCSVLTTGYFVLADSLDWQEVKSELWLSIMFNAVVEMVVIVEGVKVIFVVILVSGLCRLSGDPADPPIDVYRLREIAKKNCHFITKGPQYGMHLNYPVLQDEEALEANRRRRSDDEALLKVLYQMILYGFMLFVVYTISYDTRDPRSFYMTDHIRNMYNFEEEVTDTKSFVAWTNGTFNDNFFASTYFGAELPDDLNVKQHTEDLASIRVGPARLRQLRIVEEACEGPLARGETCYKRYASTKQDTRSYCINWKDQPCSVDEKASSFTSPAWEYLSSALVWGFPTMATYNTYSGGGYFMKLDVNKDVSQYIFNELFYKNMWLDRNTRAVIMEFTVYSPNVNLFSYVKYVAEFPEVGGVVPYTEISTFRLFTSVDGRGNFVLLCQFFFVIFVLLASGKLLYEVCSHGKSFFKSAWNWMDILAVIMSYLTTGLFIYKLLLVEITIEVFKNDKNAYVGFENLAFYDLLAIVFQAFLVFILSVRMSRILGFSGKINEMAAVIVQASDDLLGFCLIFSITYFAYVSLGTLLFGKDTAKYRDLFQTYGTLTEAIIGKNRLNSILTSSPILAQFYYFTFVLFVLLTLTTMAAAILNFSISHVKEDESKNEESVTIIGMIGKRIRYVLNRLGIEDNSNKDKPKGDPKRRESDGDVNDLISELRFFFKDWKTKAKKKYRPLTPE